MSYEDQIVRIAAAFGAFLGTLIPYVVLWGGVYWLILYLTGEPLSALVVIAAMALSDAIKDARRVWRERAPKPTVPAGSAG